MRRPANITIYWNISQSVDQDSIEIMKINSQAPTILLWSLLCYAPGMASQATGGICPSYVTQASDTCSTIAQQFNITTDLLKDYNNGTWRWAGCEGLKQGTIICTGPGSPPMPVALPRATCGPQMPGSMRPKNFADLASLNPCPSNQCVSGVIYQ